MKPPEGPPLKDSSDYDLRYDKEIITLRDSLFQYNFSGIFTELNLVDKVLDPKNRTELISTVDQLINKPLEDLYLDVSAYKRKRPGHERRARVSEIADLLEPLKESQIISETMESEVSIMGREIRKPTKKEIEGMRREAKRRLILAKERYAEIGREEIKNHWVQIRNRMCQSGFVTKLRSGEYDMRQQTFILVATLTELFTDQPIGKIFSCAAIALKIATHNLDQICTRAGFSYEKMEKKALAKEGTS